MFSINNNTLKTACVLLKIKSESKYYFWIQNIII